MDFVTRQGNAIKAAQDRNCLIIVTLFDALVSMKREGMMIYLPGTDILISEHGFLVDVAIRSTSICPLLSSLQKLT